LHSFLVVDRFDATAMKMESGWNSCQRSLRPIGQIYRILVGVVCKFCVVAQGVGLGVASARIGSRSRCGRPDAPSLLEVMAPAAVSRRASAVAARAAPDPGAGDRAIAATHVDGGLVSPGKSQITDNEGALCSRT
jgi:hypothetical protein